MNRTTLICIELGSGLAGFALLWNALGWQVAVGAFCLMWSSNVSRALQTQSSGRTTP
jgi:hypothetical protein